jgi:hypothetical protein
MSHETTGWQPLETAPRDGSTFLVWDGWQQCIASYEKGRWLATRGRGEDSRRASEPSLWHPLPEDPANV